MKKYRCQLYMSTTNHNILCFLHIPGIYFPNMGNCLWKAPKPQAGRGFPKAILPQNQCRLGVAGQPDLKTKPIPARHQAQDAKIVHFGGSAVGVVEIWGEKIVNESLTSLYCLKCGLAGIIC